MKIPMYQVDAFTSERFAGNPAAVCLMDDWPDDGLLQNIANENNLSETAFIVEREGRLELRWFTPVAEVALCGHATLASAAVLFEHRGWDRDRIDFHTRKSGVLHVGREAERLVMDFPATPVRPLSSAEPGLAEALGLEPKSYFTAGEDLMVRLTDQRQLRELQPDMAELGALDARGIIATAPGSDCDFVSRFFAPRYGIPEDPVTGSAHCALVPYWSSKLGKTSLHARQISRRGGELFCEDLGERVRIAGQAVLYLEGSITV